MNAKRAPKPIAAEHTRLMRDREPWDVPLRLLQQETLDPLQDIASEDFILAFMLDNPGRVSSLAATDFTGRDRPTIYAALKSGAELEALDELDNRLDCPGYINQLRWQASHVGVKKPILVEAVANLKRLGELRELAAKVDKWRREMATMTSRAARVELMKAACPRPERFK